ncbi:MAG: glycoside hydrolase family 15 protein, partial [Rhodospirillales bacterium]|nr:glycoside hydrolase family 15 protein [Acetobacter sp.]
MPQAPLHGARIEEYALIGDLESAALVSREGSIDWLCWPSFASPACFASLLGTAGNGYWRIKPNGSVVSIRRAYRERTAILETRFETEGGEVLLTDLMPIRGKHSDIIRSVRGIRGRVDLRMEFVLRFDYGLTVPWVTQGEHELRAIAGPNMVVLRSQCLQGDPARLHGEGLTTVAEFTLEADQEVCFVLTYAASNEDIPEAVDVSSEISDTESFWKDWSSRSAYNGPYEEAVLRSLLTLKSLSYRPTGGLVAAPTAGLPESLGGERNWDYRYCWLRDAAFTLLILILAGFTEEAVNWRLWLLRAIAGAPDQLQTLYGINGERKLMEWTANWLPGYENSRPVRIGNAAAEQFQLDVFGEVAAALGRTPSAEDDLRMPARDLQVALTDHLCHVWDQPDDGIWET